MTALVVVFITMGVLGLGALEIWLFGCLARATIAIVAGERQQPPDD